MSLVRLVRAAEQNQVATQKMSKSGFSFNDKKSKFSLIVEQRFTNTTSKPILIGEVSRNWVELSVLNEEKLITLMPVMNNCDVINNFFMNNYWNKIGIFVKLIWKVSMKWKNWSGFKGLHSMDFRKRKLIEDRDTILELTGNILELQNEINLHEWFERFSRCWMNQYAVDIPTLAVNLRFSHLFQILTEC